MNDGAGRLVIRADAGPEIGFGHVMRCIALGQAWRDDYGPVTFLSRVLPDPLEKSLIAEGFQVRPVVLRRDELSVVTGELESLRPRAVVADGYQFDRGWQTAVIDTGAPLLVIDDDAHLASYSADLVLNQNLHADAGLYAGKFDGRLLTGSQYALLRKEFLQVASQRDNRDDPQCRRLLVTLGGFDPGGITQRVIDALQMLALPGIHTTVVSAVEGLDVACDEISIVPFASNMPELIAASDLAVCAGGSTNWEMSLLGLPRLVLVLADNQRAIAESLDTAGCCRNLGRHSRVTASQISEALRELVTNEAARQAMVDANRNLVDGNGSRRVCDALANHLVTL